MTAPLPGLGLDRYEVGDFFDEMFEESGSPRPYYRALHDRMQNLDGGELERRQMAAERSMRRLGITFNVYGDTEGSERIIPFDICPRIIVESQWRTIEKGLKQRVNALNKFINDVYHKQMIVRDGVVPEFVVRSCASLRQQCMALKPPLGVWCHITGVDLVRDREGQFYVLEDNLRCPSGVSYVLQNRQLMKQTFPQVFEQARVQPVDDYCSQLLDALQCLMQDRVRDPHVVLLTPGVYNSAYFEHSYLAQQMGVPLVEGRDLVVSDGYVYMRTTRGFERVDVIYRRIDDDFIDPEAFNKDSMLGVPGLLNVYRHGRVALANAPGAGVADDKVVYAYVPQMIRYYLDEDPIIPNVETFVCWDDSQRKYVLDNIEKLVVKPANESGGYGMLIGPRATAAECDKFRELVKAKPRNYIAQPTLNLSRVPVLTEQGMEGRHVDLRPFVIYGREIYVLPGGLTRVALRKGSLVVNSSQGGGSKDTWVMSDEEIR
jgi:uncharacterized circularly permuted ATP-grasp superfamily protein